MKPKLLIVGDVGIEIICELRHMPEPAEVLAEDKYSFLPGAEAGNSALCADGLGVSAQLCSRVGKDGNAARLRSFFYENNIDTGTIFTDSSAQTALTVYLSDTSRASVRTIEYRAAASKLCTQDVDTALEGAADMVLVLKNTSAPVCVHIAQRASSLGIPVFFEASCEGLSALEEASAQGIEFIYADSDTFESYTGIHTRDVEHCLKCCLAVEQKVKSHFYIIRIKNRGLFVYDGKFYNIVSATDLSEAYVKCGFADIEVAALASEYLVSEDIVRSCRVAEIADKIARQSATVRIPSREIIENFALENDIDL